MTIPSSSQNKEWSPGILLIKSHETYTISHSSHMDHDFTLYSANVLYWKSLKSCNNFAHLNDQLLDYCNQFDPMDPMNALIQLIYQSIISFHRSYPFNPFVTFNFFDPFKLKNPSNPFDSFNSIHPLKLLIHLNHLIHLNFLINWSI